MTTISGTYLGGLRVAAKHEASGATLISDAPVDNGGQGRGFSPTDLCAAALAMCALSIMGLFARNHGLNIDGATYTVNKIMSDKPPRRLAKIEVTFNFPDNGYSDKDKISLERAAKACPVHMSLHPEVEQVLVFNWAK